MDAHTLRVLEYDKVLALVAEKTRSEKARRAALSLPPSSDITRVGRDLRLAGEKTESLLTGFRRPWERLLDLIPALARLRSEGSRLDREDLLELARQLRAARQVRHYFEEEEERYPHSAEEVAGLTPHSEIVNAVDAALDEDGQVKDDASSALFRLRRERERVRKELEQKLARALRSSQIRDALQEEVITIRNERMVIPVKAERKSQVQGIVHDLSGSGQTVFVEPMVTVPLNNRLREIAREEEEEIERILARLTELVRPAVEELIYNSETLAAVDLQFAKAEFSLGMECIEPRLREDGEIRIAAGRHPLLVDARRKAPAGDATVVPLDFDLGGETRAVVITGPNTGGKTVALKTVGLLTLMAQAGIPVPAREGTELSVFQSIFADVGDEQSIEDDLSTFSSHIRQISKVAQRASSSSLILLDELGAGTDPDEGSALSQAVLEELLARGARVVATTHHGALKGVAHLDPRMENASLEFDPESLRPTFEFRQGIPGSSRGLDIAQRLGVPAATVARARDLVGGERVSLEKLLADLESELSRARDEREEAIRIRGEAEELRAHWEEEDKAIKREAKSRRREARREAESVVTEARSLVERLVGEIRGSQASRESVKEAGAALKELERRLGREDEEERRAETPGLDPNQVRPGSVVHIESLGRDGVVLASPSGGRVRVQAGKLRLEVPLSDLRLEGGAAAQPPTMGRGGVTRPGDEDTADHAPLGEVDLRGCTAEEAVESLDQHLDGALLAGYPQVRIIHGKGTGVLRSRVQEYLKRHPRVKSFHLGEWNEGGSGVTVAHLS